MMDENTEKNSELDEYGVWVKKAPENAQTEKPQTEDLKLPDFSFLDQQAEETPEPQELKFRNQIPNHWIFLTLTMTM